MAKRKKSAMIKKDKASGLSLRRIKAVCFESLPVLSVKIRSVCGCVCVGWLNGGKQIRLHPLCLTPPIQLGRTCSRFS